MKLTIALALVVAALGGALVATAANDDDDRPVQAAAPSQPVPSTTTATGPAVETAPLEATDPDDRPIGRRELRRVRDAALQASNGGQVVDIDRSDDAGVAYEIEIRRQGRDIDVHLDRNLRAVSTNYDD